MARKEAQVSKTQKKLKTTPDKLQKEMKLFGLSSWNQSPHRCAYLHPESCLGEAQPQQSPDAPPLFFIPIPFPFYS